MEINTKIKYYQTYSIPLDIDYANLKEGRNEEYGDYCLKMAFSYMVFQTDIYMPITKKRNT